MKQRILFLLTCLLCTIAMKGQPMTANTLGDLSSFQVTTKADLDTKIAAGTWYFIIADATGAYTMSNTAPFYGAADMAEAGYRRPQYQTYVNPFAAASQVWKIEKEVVDEKDYYSFRTYTDDYLLFSYTTGYQNWIGAEGSVAHTEYKNYEVEVNTSIFKFKAPSVVVDVPNVPGQYLGPWNSDGGVNLTTNTHDALVDNGHEDMASNKTAANAPGFRIYAIPRTRYEYNRTNSASLMRHGWTKVLNTDQLGREEYEYLLLDASEIGIESGFALSGDATNPKYSVLTSSSEPDNIHRWLLHPHGGGYSIKNKEKGTFMNCVNPWAPSFTPNEDANKTAFDFTPLTGDYEGFWTIANHAHNTTFVGRYTGDDGKASLVKSDPYQNEGIAYNKLATKGRRFFVILYRLKNNSTLTEGWTEMTSLPSNADLNKYFYAFYTTKHVGMGLKLGDGIAGNQGSDKRTMLYAANLNPNDDPNGLWTLAYDPANAGNIVNTSPMYPEYILQTERDWSKPDVDDQQYSPWFYHTNDNGGGDCAWGSLEFDYDAGNKWTIRNKYYDALTTDKYLGNWGNAGNGVRDPEDRQEVSFNKTDAGKDYFHIYRILRGDYVTRDVEGKGDQNISYIITNAEATRRSTIGWTMSETDAFEIQTNNAWAKSGDFYFQKWIAWPGRISDRSMFQEYEHMPAGTYTLRVLTNKDEAANWSGAFIFMSDGSNKQRLQFTECNDDGVLTLEWNFENDGFTLRFGVELDHFATNWVAFDRFELYFRGHKDMTNVRYLYNKGADAYLAAGHPNDAANGTAAMLTKSGAIDVGLTNGGVSPFAIDTKIYNGGANHFLSDTYDDDENQNLHLDAAEVNWTTEDAGDGYVYLRSGGNYLTNVDGQVKLTDTKGSDNNMKWKLKTYEDRVNEMKNMTADGTTTMDVTFLIDGANFGYRDSRNEAWSVEIDGALGSWCEGNYEIKNGYHYGEPVHDTHTRGGSTTQVRFGGHNDNYLAEVWHHRTDVYQTLTTRKFGTEEVTLPPGVYTLSAKGFDGDGDGKEHPELYNWNSYLYIADVDIETQYCKTGHKNVSRGYYRGHPLATDTVALARNVDAEGNWINMNAGATQEGTPQEHDPYYFICDEITNDEFEPKNWLSTYFRDPNNEEKLTVTTPECFVFGNPTESGNPVTLRIGLRNEVGDQWLIFDDFRLTYRPFYWEKDKVDEYGKSVKLLTNIETVNAVPPVYTKPFCVPTDDADYVAITEQEALVNGINSSTTVAQMRDEFLKLRMRNIDYIEDAQVELYGHYDQFAHMYSLKNEVTGDAVLTVKSTKADADADNKNNISLAFSENAGSIYPQAIQFNIATIGEQPNIFELQYKDGFGNMRNLATGDTENSVRSDGTAAPIKFRIIPQTEADGKWYLKHMTLKRNMDIDPNENFDMAHRTKFFMASKQVGNVNFSFPEAQMAPELPTKVTGQYHFSTIISPYDVELTTLDGATGGGSIRPYKIKSVGEGKTILTSDDKIRANVPYILYNASETDNAEVTLQNFGQAFTDIDFEENSLVGTFRNNEVDIPVGSFILSVKNYPSKGNVMAWYRVVDSGRKATAYKCFFRPNSSVGGNVSAFIFAFDDEEEVDAIAPALFNPDNTILDIFDMTGKKLPRLQKGVNLLKMSDGSIQKVLVQ